MIALPSSISKSADSTKEVNVAPSPVKTSAGFLITPGFFQWPLKPQMAF